MKIIQLTTLLLSLVMPVLLAQGPLAPPGAPGPTMKSLDQIEARTPIPASPAVPVSGPHFTISAPGSYYLTGNITIKGGDAIVINSSDVTLDLNGFKISSNFIDDATGSAIAVTSGRARLNIRNGFIVSGTTVDPGLGSVINRGFSRGISGTNSPITQVLVENIHVFGVAGVGINLGYDGEFGYQGIVRNCTAKHCGVSGILAEEVMNSSASYCIEHGIGAQNANNCTASAIRTYGIYCLGNATNCKGFANTYGIFCAGNASNCNGTSGSSGNGLSCAGNVSNCTGTSYYGTGITCNGNVTNSTGTSTSGSYGMNVVGTASFCRGKRNGGVAIQATIAIGCTVEGTGTVTSAQKHLGTP